MRKLSHQEISQSIKNICYSTISFTSLKDFINLCHKIAVVYLRSKGKDNNYYINNYGLSLEDFALDSIAELFRKNENGVFSEFVNYFKNILEKEHIPDVELFITLRKLVFSKVNDFIFRSNKTFDPSLGKLIRNIKQSCQNHTNLEIDTFWKQKVIRLKDYNLYSDTKPVITVELLNLEIYSSIIKANNTNSYLDIVTEFLSQQSEYKKLLYINDLGIIIRNIFSSEARTLRDNITNIDLYDDDIMKLINTTIISLNAFMKKSYIAKGKITGIDFSNYLSIIKDILVNEYLFSNDGSDSYYSHFVKYYDSFTKQEYAEAHRTRIEYLAKIAKDKMNELVKSEYFSL